MPEDIHEAFSCATKNHDSQFGQLRVLFWIIWCFNYLIISHTNDLPNPELETRTFQLTRNSQVAAIQQLQTEPYGQ